MPTLAITKNYLDSTTLTQAQLDDALTSVETFTNTTKLDSANIQTGGLATANYAALSVDAAALAANAVTTTKITDANVTTAKLADSAVTTAKITDASVTQAKRAALGQQISSSSGNFSTTSTTYVDVTNLSRTFTSTGRPVRLEFQPDGSTNNSYVGAYTGVGPTAFGIIYKLFRDSTEIAYGLIASQSESTAASIFVPVNSLSFTDTGASAASYTYKIQVASEFSGHTAYLQYTKLLVYEL